MLHIARVRMLNSNQLRKVDISGAIAELEKGKDLLHNSIRIARRVLDNLTKQKGNLKSYSAPGETRMDGSAALVILLQSLDALGLAEINKRELQELREHLPVAEAENALFQCLSAYKEFETKRSISDSPAVKAEYLSCVKHLSSLIIDTNTESTQRFKGVTLKELEDEIKRLESELHHRKRKKLSYKFFLMGNVARSSGC
ncbi:hypothetical protein SLA2020_402530 [Shorea laevis]